MGDIRIHEKPNAVPNNAAVFAIEMEVGGVWYTRKVTWEQLTGLIAALNNLQNYYLKTETYTKTEVNQLIAAIPTFTIEIVEELPTTDISTSTLYLVPKTTAGTLDYYDEYINLDGTTSGWEYVGKTEVDLSNYYTKAETEAYVKGDGADYIAGTKTFSSLTTTAKTILAAINEAAGAASGAQADATQALSDASAAQGTANSASSAASAAQGTADNALTAAGNAANAASAAQGTANTALTTAQSMAVSVTNTLTPGDTTKKVADVTQNSTTTSIYADDAEKVVVALTDEQTTAPGNPVTLTTVQEGGAKSALVTFSPKQSGTGDPSPSNIRPIIGWGGLDLVQDNIYFDKTQKNISKGYVENRYLNDSGNLRIPTGDSWYVSEFIEVNPFTEYTIKGLSTTDSNAPCLALYSEDKTFISAVQYRNFASITFTTTSTTKYIRLSIGPLATTENNIVIESPQHTTHTATFPDTVYGGEYDFVSGKCLTEYSLVTYNGTENWNLITDTPHVFYISISGNYQNEITVICDKYKGVANGSSGSVNNNEIRRNRNMNNILVRDDRASTVEEFKALCAAENINVAYFRNTPTEITLTPADVNLLKGSNTVWTDGDTVQIKYSELPNGNLGAVIDYIKKLEARVKALES